MEDRPLRRFRHRNQRGTVRLRKNLKMLESQPQTIENHIRKRIVYAAFQRRISMKDLAIAVRIHPDTVVRILLKQARLSFDFIYRVAAILGVNYVDLIDGYVPPSKRVTENDVQDVGQSDSMSSGGVDVIDSLPL